MIHLLPGVGEALGGLVYNQRAIRRALAMPPPEPQPATKDIYSRGQYNVKAWVERINGRPGAYVAITRGYHQVWLRRATIEPAPWWKPWRRKHELAAVVSAAIAYIDEQDSLETTAHATLEAVTEVMRLT